MVTRATHLLLPPTGAFIAEIMLLPPTEPSNVHAGFDSEAPPTRWHAAPSRAHALHACTTCDPEKADCQGAMDVGTSYEDFKAVEECLEKLKKEHHHPVRVYNSQSAENYNRKRIKMPLKNRYPNFNLL